MTDKMPDGVGEEEVKPGTSKTSCTKKMDTHLKHDFCAFFGDKKHGDGFESRLNSSSVQITFDSGCRPLGRVSLGTVMVEGRGNLVG